MISMASHIPAIESPLRRRRGFTLIEALAAGVVLAITMAGLADVLVARYQQITDAQQTSQAMALGRELMDEIASKPLANPSSGSTTPAVATAVATTTTQPSTYARSSFVAVGDYNGYTDSGQDIYTLGGTDLPITSGEKFTRLVTVTQGAKPSGDTLSPGTDFSLVTVTVTAPSGRTVQLQRVVPNYTFSR
jgi:type II secretory pathway pseudopilin PulG